MNAEIFVDLLQKISRRNAIKTTTLLFEDLDGKGYNKEMRNLCENYKKLSNIDKTTINNIIEFSIDNAFFTLLCVIDGVSIIEDGPNKGEFELYYVKNNKKILLNDNGDFLHDYYDGSKFI